MRRGMALNSEAMAQLSFARALHRTPGKGTALKSVGMEKHGSGIDLLSSGFELSRNASAKRGLRGNGEDRNAEERHSVAGAMSRVAEDRP